MIQNPDCISCLYTAKYLFPRIILNSKSSYTMSLSIMGKSLFSDVTVAVNNVMTYSCALNLKFNHN